MKNTQKTVDAEPLPLVGGQAVIEGVMMRAPGTIATAVRRPDGTIALRTEPFVPLSANRPWLKLPVFRGAVGLVEMLVAGVRALNYSADVAFESAGTGGEPGSQKVLKRRTSSLGVGLTIAGAFAFALLLFFVTPLAAASWILPPDENPLLYNLLAGGFRLTIFLGYLVTIAMMQDVRRLFAYHGAEHKAVFAFEHGGALSPEEAGLYSRFHPRCGTSFLLIVMLSAIVLFAMLDGVLMLWFNSLTIGIRLASHLPLLPLVAGLSYEAIRLSSRHANSRLGRLLIAPGLWLQRITTREPDPSQLEVALVALRAALGQNRQEESSSSVLASSGGAIVNA